MASSMRQIARMLGLSVATVSNVVNGHPKVAPETRERVERALAEAAYERPASQKTRFLVVFPYVSIESSEPGQSYFVHEIIHGMQHVLAKNRQRLVVAGVDGVTPPSSLPEAQDCAATFVAGGAFEPKTLIAIGQLLKDKPLVVVGTTVLEEVADTVVADNAGGLLQATRYLMGLGHRRIALINGLPSSSSAEEKRQGFCRAFAERGWPLEDHWLKESDYTIAGAQQATNALLDLQPRPTAILVADDPMAIGVIRAARSRHVRVPEELSVIGFGDDYPGIDPPLTTVRVNKHRLGELGFFLMRERMEAPARDGELIKLVLSTQLVVRGSTAPPS